MKRQAVLGGLVAGLAGVAAMTAVDCRLAVASVRRLRGVITELSPWSLISWIAVAWSRACLRSTASRWTLSTRCGRPARPSRQILENVLSNAIKFSPVGAAVVVELDVASAGTRCWAVVTVSDQEPGIPPDLFPRLFERFARGPGWSGLGIGLYLASRIVAAHGGTLTADPPPTISAKFQMKLPLAEAPLSEGDGPHEVGKSASR